MIQKWELYDGGLAKDILSVISLTTSLLFLCVFYGIYTAIIDSKFSHNVFIKSEHDLTF